MPIFCPRSPPSSSAEPTSSAAADATSARFVGVILIVLLNSVLSIMEMPEAGRQVIYGGVIILMLLVYGRSEEVTS